MPSERTARDYDDSSSSAYTKTTKTSSSSTSGAGAPGARPFPHHHHPTPSSRSLLLQFAVDSNSPAQTVTCPMVTTLIVPADKIAACAGRSLKSEVARFDVPSVVTSHLY